jgi:MFS family permease
VSVAAGFASGFLNPILGAVIFERVPRPMMGRVTSLTTSLCWAGMPFGSVIGGVLVATAGLGPALLVCGVAYLLATMLPAVRPEWREIDHRREPAASHPERVPTGG